MVQQNTCDLLIPLIKICALPFKALREIGLAVKWDLMLLSRLIAIWLSYRLRMLLCNCLYVGFRQKNEILVK